MNNSNKIQENKCTATTIEQEKQKHMQLLHEYNNLKDATQTVLGALAQAKGLPVKDMYKRYNLPIGD